MASSVVSALDSEASGPGLSLGRGHCVVFLGKNLYSNGAIMYLCHHVSVVN